MVRLPVGTDNSTVPPRAGDNRNRCSEAWLPAPYHPPSLGVTLPLSPGHLAGRARFLQDLPPGYDRVSVPLSSKVTNGTNGLVWFEEHVVLLEHLLSIGVHGSRDGHSLR